MTLRNESPPATGPGRWPLAALGARELLDGYRAREFSPVEVVEQLAEAVDALNPILACFTATDFDRALGDARRAERTWSAAGEGSVPPLCGVPVSVKDTIEIAGMPTTYGSLAFRDNVREDGLLGTRLREAGALVFAKASSSEFALAIHTVTRLGESCRNPWDRTRSAGGSSGGSGAAVAAGLGPISIGTDSAGSVRIPAAFSGALGLKPTFQVIENRQAWRAGHTRSHNGVITRRADDLQLALHALATPPPGRSVRAPRIADTPSLAGAVVAVVEVEGADLEQLHRCAAALADLGATVRHEALPRWEWPPAELAPGVSMYSGDHYGAAEKLVPGFWDNHADDLTPYARPLYDGGRRALAWQYRLALGRVDALADEARAWADRFDYVLTGGIPAAPPLPDLDAVGVGSPYQHINIWNLTRHPALMVPAFGSDPTLPTAVQLVGRHHDDEGLVRIARRLEEIDGWSARWPALSTGAPAASLGDSASTG